MTLANILEVGEIEEFEMPDKEETALYMPIEIERKRYIPKRSPIDIDGGGYSILRELGYLYSD